MFRKNRFIALILAAVLCVGMLQTSAFAAEGRTGFVTSAKNKWYVENGEITFDVCSVIKDTKGDIGEKGTWYYVTGSRVRSDFTGLADYKNANGWWYIRDGVVDFNASGVYRNVNGWWFVNAGKVRFAYNGFGVNENGKWYINNGKVTFKTNDIIKDTSGALGTKGTWYYVVGSKVQTGYTGVGDYKNSNGWWYIKNGKVDFSYTGIASNIYGSWYVKDGKVDFSANGTYESDDIIYTLVDGKVMSEDVAEPAWPDDAEPDGAEPVGPDDAEPDGAESEHAHVYVSEITKPATCTSDGVITYVCECGSRYTETIPATGHDYVIRSTQDPTCTEDGKIVYVCKNCGDSYTESLAKTGHSYVLASTKDATCTEDGEKVYVCFKCGDSYTEKTAATGHEWAETYHEATGHYESVLVQEAYDEKVKIGSQYVCNTCGWGTGVITETSMSELTYHMLYECEGNRGTYHVEYVYEYVHHDAEYEEQWVQDTAAYTSYTCSKCGATR